MKQGILKRLSFVLCIIILPYPVGLIIPREHRFWGIWVVGLIACLIAFIGIMIIVGITIWVIDGD